MWKIQSIKNIKYLKHLQTWGEKKTTTLLYSKGKTVSPLNTLRMFYFWHQVCGIFPHQTILLLFRHLWVSLNSTQFWKYLCGVSIRSYKLKGSVPQDCLHFRHQSQFTYIYDWPAINWGFPQPPSCFDNLQE